MIHNMIAFVCTTGSREFWILASTTTTMSITITTTNNKMIAFSYTNGGKEFWILAYNNNTVGAAS